MNQIDKCEELLEIARRERIRIDFFPLYDTESLVIEYLPARYSIAIDPAKITSAADQKVKLAHELGHCMTKAIYSRLTPLETRERCEHKANAWAIQQLTPWTGLYLAVEVVIVDA